MGIDLQAWKESLEKLTELVLPKETHISSTPLQFFDGFFCDEGLPVSPEFYPIWDDKGVVIYVDSAQTFVFGLSCGRWRKFRDSPCHRVFWISEEGIFGEMDESNGRVTEFFPATSPEATAEYVALLCGKQLERGGRQAEREVAIEDIVADTYVRFFRYPDDLSPRLEELPWVSTRRLGEVVKLHIEKPAAWLQPFMWEFRELELRKKIKDEPESAKTIQWQFAASKEKISPEGLIVRLNSLAGEGLGSLRQSCITAASQIEDADLLDSSATWRLQLHKLAYALHLSPLNLELEVGALLVHELFPDFVCREVNPVAWKSVRQHILGPWLSGAKADAPVRLAIPNGAEQRRRAFEARAYRHAINLISRRLSQFQAGNETASELHGLLANRYSEVATVLERMPTHDTELERAHRPLPYFIEAPLIAWERASENLKLQNGFMAFGNLLKTAALLGITELQGVRNGLSEFTPPPPDVIGGVCGNPSLGHWSKCLDWLSHYVNALPMFGGWIRSLHEHRAQLINLTELRNKYAHPAGVLERAFIEHVNRQLEEFFATTVRRLRRETRVKMLIPLSRRALRREYETVFEFDGLDLCSPYPRFREASFILSATNSGGVIEGEILALHDGDHSQVLPLQAFIRAKKLSPDRCAILLYDKAFDGKNGIFSAIDSEVQEKLLMQNSPLEFKRS